MHREIRTLPRRKGSRDAALEASSGASVPRGNIDRRPPGPRRLPLHLSGPAIHGRGGQDQRRFHGHPPPARAQADDGDGCQRAGRGWTRPGAADRSTARLRRSRQGGPGRFLGCHELRRSVVAGALPREGGTAARPARRVHGQGSRGGAVMRSAAIRPAECSDGTKAVWMFERREGIRLVRVAGRLGLAEMRMLDSQLEQIARPGDQVVLDLRAVTHVDYRSLEILGRRAERLAREGGALALCRMSAYVRAILMLGASPGLLEVHEREEEALASVATGVS